MKGIFIILDGVADLPHPQLNQKTPLEFANTPNLDEIAKKSRIDFCYPVKEGVAPQSSNAVVSLLGRDPDEAPRRPLEAQGAGIPIKTGDLVLRANFATIDNLQDLNVLDRRAGRTLTTKEARTLAKAINEKVKLSHGFEFFATIQHRSVLVFRGGFSDNITNADPGYKKGLAIGSEEKFHFSHPVDDEDDSKLSSELVNNLIRHSYDVLNKHQINIKRAKKGLYAANIILCRDAGNKPVKLKKLKGRWLALGYFPLEKGIARSLGMPVYKFKYPKMKGIDIYANLHRGLSKSVKYAKRMLKWNRKKIDYFYIHFKETDIPGHDNKPLEKVKMIEFLDKHFFSFLKNFIEGNKLVLTADHTTACKMKSHTADPVPVLIYPNEKTSEKRFTELEGSKGKKILSRDLLENNLFKN